MPRRPAVPEASAGSPAPSPPATRRRTSAASARARRVAEHSVPDDETVVEALGGLAHDGGGKQAGAGAGARAGTVTAGLDLQSLVATRSELERKLGAARTSIDNVLDDLMSDINESFTPSTRDDHKKAARTRGRAKEFVLRESCLTRLFELKDFQTIYSMMVATLLWLAIGIVIDNYEQGGLWLDLSLMWQAFGKFDLGLTLWFALFAVAFSVIPLRLIIQKGFLGRLIGYALYTAIQVAMFVQTGRLIARWELPFATSVMVLCEQVRLSMKMHAYLREKSKMVDTVAPMRGQHLEASRFCSFVFSPTLLYRDDYPVSPHPTRWTFVCIQFGNVALCLTFTFVVFQKFVASNDFVRLPSQSPLLLARAILSCMIPGTITMLTTWFLLLHSWQNAFAEILRFGDRQFYEEWWLCEGFHQYYARWNLVVHEWLFEYCYADVRQFGSVFAKVFTFIFSAIVHEWIIGNALGFAMPMLAVEFVGFAFPLIIASRFISSRLSPWVGNFLMWVLFFLGNGLLLCVYPQEFFIRHNMIDEMAATCNRLGLGALGCHLVPHTFARHF